MKNVDFVLPNPWENNYPVKVCNMQAIVKWKSLPGAEPET